MAPGIQRVRPGKRTRFRSSGSPRSAFPDKECRPEVQFGLGDLVVKYQRIMVKHMVINLTGTILQFESGFFICLGCAGLRIQKKVGKAVLSVKGQAVIASLGVWQNRDIKRRMSADGEYMSPSLLFATFQLTVRVRPFRMWRMRSTKSKG